MQLRRSFALLVLISADCPGATSGEVKAAAQRTVKLIQTVNAQWKTPCLSCHHQVLGGQAIAAARVHGLTVDETMAQSAGIRDYRMMLDLDGAVRVDQLIDPAMSEGSMLMGAQAAGIQPSLVTAVYARHIARNQFSDGHWAIFDNRPPHSHSEISATAIAARAISAYLPVKLDAEKKLRLARARRWLVSASTPDTEDVTFRLLGLLWTQGTAREIDEAERRLAKLQRADGAWAQTERSTASDAYSTGQALYALRKVNHWKTTDRNYQRGLDWLMSKQAADGSWHVASRLHTPAPISPSYFESGFPYGKDQFISAAATSWGLLALTEALPERPPSSSPLPVPTFDSSKMVWAETALFGQPEDLAAIDPNAATTGGTTALMMAADNAAKIEVLLKRGANPNATTKEGYDAAMMAALYHGNTQPLALLLKAGIAPVPKQKVRFDASALALAILSNDAGMVQLLLLKGANPNYGMRILGGQVASPLAIASLFGNVGIIRLLAEAGAKIEDPDETGMTSLSWAAIAQRPAAIRALLELGASPKNKDKFGLTPFDHTGAIREASPEAAAILKGR